MGIQVFTSTTNLQTDDAYGDRLDGGEPYDRAWATAGLTMTTQTLRLSYFTAHKSVSVSSVLVLQGSTAAGATPTLVRFGLWTAGRDGALNALVASTANDTALLAGSANTEVTKALSASYTFIPGQRYAGGALVVTAATAPTILGRGTGNVSATAKRVPCLSGSVGSQTDLPTSVAAGSVSANTNSPYIAFI